MSSAADPRRTAATADPLAKDKDVDPARALVMGLISRLVRAGHGEWRSLDNGDVELRLSGGEVFHLERQPAPASSNKNQSWRSRPLATALNRCQMRRPSLSLMSPVPARA